MTGPARPPSIGIFYAWWRGDPLDPLPPVPGLVIETVPDASGIATLDQQEAATLLRDGHRLYVARLDGAVVAHGWSATRHAAIGELGVELRLSPDERYLWGFETQPEHRGRGIYTRMLRAMLERETDAERFWVGHDVGNDASARGILRAGFQPVGEVYQRADGALRYVITGDERKGRAGGVLLGIQLDETGMT